MSIKTILLLIALVAAAAVVVVVILKKRQARVIRDQNDGSLSGSTEMMGAYEIRRRAADGDYALVIGNHIDPDNPRKHSEDYVADYLTEAAIVFGPPGSGKTAFQLAPNILRHDGPVFASTTKGDIVQATLLAALTRQRLAQGADRQFDIAIFDPDGLIETGAPHDAVLEKAAEHVQVWTPICEAVTWDRASAVAQAMITAVDSHDNSDGGGNSGFFTKHSTNIVAALLLLARFNKGSTLYDVLNYVEDLSGVDSAKVDDDTEDAWAKLMMQLGAGETATRKKLDIAEQNGGKGTAGYKRLQDQARATRLARMALKPSLGAVKAAETKAGIIGAISQLTSDWLMSPAVMEQAWDAENTLDVEKLAPQHAVYLTCPTVEHRPLANAFLGAYMKELHRRAMRSGGKLPQRHLVVLDELAYCTPHSDMLSWANNVARSAGIKLFLGTQAMSDLEIVWGEAKSRSLFNACKGSKVLMPGCTDSKALKEFSELAGKRNLIQVSSVSNTTSDSSSFSGLKVVAEDGRLQRSTSETVTQSAVEKDTASPARLAAVPADTALAWLPGQPGVPGGTAQVRTIPFFKDKLLRAASEGQAEAVQQASMPPGRNARLVNDEDPLRTFLNRKRQPAQ